MGTAFGYPTITQTGTTTAFNRDTAAATDTEAFALAFPNAGVTDILGNDAIGGLTLRTPDDRTDSGPDASADSL